MNRLPFIGKLLGALLLLSSCIHEQRSRCPAWLTIHFEDVPHGTEEMYLIIQNEHQTYFRDTLTPMDWKQPFSLEVPRETLHLALWSHTSNLEETRDGFVIPPGHQADSLYFDSFTTTPNQDLVNVTLTPKKNFSNLTISLTASADSSANLIWTFEGSSVGQGHNAAIITGTFCYQTDTPTCRIPRQASDDLTLTLTQNNRLIHRFPLGKFLIEAGYDNQAKELIDWNITLDYANLLLNILPEDWEEVIPYNPIF